MIEKPGLYTLTAAEYHADPCPAPSLSSSIARTLLSCSPRHAWFDHPRLNSAHQREHDEKFDRGTAAHAYLLEGEAGCVLVNAKDWRTDKAKAERDAAYAAFKVPMLAHRWQDVIDMVEAANRQLDAFTDPPRPLAFGKPEQTIVWRESGIWCRVRLDWLHDHGGYIDDYKSTAQPAEPDRWTRGPLFSMGYDVQAAFYLRGLRSLGVEGIFRFVVQENYAPFELSVIGLGPDVIELADQKVDHAISLWRRCLEDGAWPGYPSRTCWADLPPWEQTRWLERTSRGAPPPPVDGGGDIGDQLAGMGEDHV